MTERLNIRRIQAPAEGGEGEFLPFDPARDIAPEDWKDLGEAFTEGNYTHAERFEFAAFVHILAPKRRLISKTEVEDLDEECMSDTSRHDSVNKMKAAAWVKMLGFDPIEIQFYREHWETVENYCHNLSVQHNWPQFLPVVFWAKIYSNKNSTEFALTDAECEMARERLSKDLSVRVVTTMESLAALKVLRPDMAIPLTNENWKDIKQWISKCRGEDWAQFVQTAGYATILAAHEAKITDAGLQITLRKPRDSLPDGVGTVPEALEL